MAQIGWAFNDYFPVINFTPTKWGASYISVQSSPNTHTAYAGQDAVIGAAAPPPTPVQVKIVGGKIPTGEITLEVDNNPPDANVVTVNGFAAPRVPPAVVPQFFVQVRGGDYFFVPSVSTLRSWSRA